MNEHTVFYIIPLMLFMLMLVTKSYKKSISTAVSIISLLIAGYVYKYSHTLSFMIMAMGIFLMQIRAIVNHNEDKLLKR